MGKYVKSRAQQERQQGERGLTACELAERWPALWEYLSVVEWEDSRKRVPSSLSLFLAVEEGCLKACLNDRELSRVAFVSGCSLSSLLDSLDEGLRGETLDWRHDRYAGLRKRGGKA